VALPSPSLDASLRDGRSIPIEERDPSEVTHLTGQLPSGEIATVRLAPEGTPAANPGFDVTPARLITALITERGVCSASEEGLRALFPERFPEAP
jgi:methylthioribose-1-phosphate isomerase